MSNSKPVECVSPVTNAGIFQHQHEYLVERNRLLRDMLREAEWSGPGQRCFWCGGDFMKHKPECRAAALLK